MKKDIITLGLEIPEYTNLNKSFNSHLSLMDADIVVISPEIVKPDYNGWVRFTSGGGGCYDVSTSHNFAEKVSHLKQELLDMLKLGKSVFIFLSKKKKFQLAQSVSHPRKGENTYSTITSNNYEFLPFSISRLTSAAGNKVKFTGNPIFNEFHKNFSDNLSYETYTDKTNCSQVIYTGKDENKVLGAIYKIEKGHLITLPQLNYDSEDSKNFGKKFVQSLIDIDEKISTDSTKTPIPDWALKKDFITKKALLIEKSIKTNEKKLEDLKSKNEVLKDNLNSENEIRNLLFENGIALENSVTKALKILGYEAENYDDGVLELDQVIKSPEGHRFIGECEGRDNKDINITKFRQLLESLNADFARDDVQEKAYGILFGNPQRLIDPKSRKLDFTEKCKIGAKREQIALIKTQDLFYVIKYLIDNENEGFKVKCREAIFKGLGKIVKFPKIPK